VSDEELDRLEAQIPELAVLALNEAQSRARASGRPMVIVEDGKLMRIDQHGKTVLEVLPERFSPVERKKRIA